LGILSFVSGAAQTLRPPDGLAILELFRGQTS
jgi:hypothetical protein